MFRQEEVRSHLTIYTSSVKQLLLHICDSVGNVQTGGIHTARSSCHVQHTREHIVVVSEKHVEKIWSINKTKPSKKYVFRVVKLWQPRSCNYQRFERTKDIHLSNNYSYIYIYATNIRTCSILNRLHNAVVENTRACSGLRRIMRTVYLANNLSTNANTLMRILKTILSCLPVKCFI